MLLLTCFILSLITYVGADLSLSYLNRQCGPKVYSEPFKCPEFNTDLIRIDVATFYEPISGDCSSECNVIRAYEKKVIYNKEWIMLLDGSAAYKVNALHYKPQCYPGETIVVDGNVPVSLLKDRINFTSEYEYVLKEGSPIFSFLPRLGRRKVQAMTVQEKEFFMFLTLFLMKNNTDYNHENHHKNNEFYDIATDSKLKVEEIDTTKAQQLLDEMYTDAIDMLVETAEVQWNRLCEVANTEKGQFYEEVMAATY
uniref:Secreted protein n=1 Tax=Parastrongyloides trichosuri TaxID=131310 RepID=A0A0N4ZCQ0_PARTI